MTPRERYMRRALELAALGRGMTSPNPLVGAVLVKGGRAVGEGWHRRAGEPHAEANALREAGERARGADLYVNLEPCSHQGRTPPCADSIIAAGVARVFAACLDPNPLVNGRGVAILRERGVKVETGLLEGEARRLNEAYCKHVTTGLPFVTIKVALSLDGKMATRTGDCRWISNEQARMRVHEWRAASDAVMVGVGTVLADDPLLNVRLPGWEGRQPLRVIVDSLLRMPANAKVLGDEPGGSVLVAATQHAPASRVEALEAAGARILRIESPREKVHLPSLLADLGSRGVTSVLLEGGAGIITSFLEGGLADKAAVFIAPIIVGGRDAPSPGGGEGVARIADAARLREVTVETLGDNVLIQGYLSAAT